jgi:hypothetical protein
MATTQRAPFHDARFAAKGGSAWLHQHVMNNYVYCWQQGLSNGEIDGAVCDIGTHLRMVSIMIPHQIYHDQKSGLTEIHLRFAMPVLVVLMTRSRYLTVVQLLLGGATPLCRPAAPHGKLHRHIRRPSHIHQKVSALSLDRAVMQDGIYYDGINFARDGMQRVRKTIDRAAVGKPFAPLIDMHTGNGGANAPAGVRYIAHMAYADSLWNGEGFKWDLGPDYWLVEVSGLIHGIPADRLGGDDDIKGMLYATYRRNSRQSHAIWRFWDSVQIQQMAMIGYWEADLAATLSWPPHGPDLDQVPPVTPANTTCTWKETIGKFITGSAGAAGDIGFGSSCGPPRKFDYPAMTVEHIKQTCCKLGDGCVAFSWAKKQDPGKPGTACARKSWGNGGYSKMAGFNGYEKTNVPRPTPPPVPPPPPPPGVCPPDSILATAYVNYGVRAVVVVASWCASPKHVSMHLDWATLGMAEGQVEVIQPEIEGVQPAKNHGDGKGFFMVTDALNGGVILVITQINRE